MSTSEHFPLRGGSACECGWNYGLSLNDTRSDMKLFVEHLKQISKSDGWDEALNAFAWCLDRSDDVSGALSYVAKNNPYKEN